MLAYEELLQRDVRHAFREGSMHFENESAVHRCLRSIAARLDELQIPYAIAGGMALFFHGYRRFTEDVHILITPEGLSRLHAEVDGRGYLPPFAGSRNLRDTDSGVRIEFLVSGEFPGDGKPKPVPFPDPSDRVVEIDGIRFLRLATLIELKLASGISSPRRARDLADVQELIDLLQLPRDLSEDLNPYVRDKYLDLWQIMHSDETS